jgi:hypothetical protein
MRDYKSAVGEKRGEAIGRGLEPEDLESIFAAPETVNEADAQPPTFEGEPWPEDEQNEEVPETPHEQDVRELASTAGRSMIDVTKAPAPRIRERVASESSPSDRTWTQTIKEVFRPAGLRAWSAPLARGLVRPSIMGHDEQEKT